MDCKHETEKSLKRFLKNKVAYTAGLLVAFLITGAAGYASSVELASQAEMTKEELLANIAAQKAEIQGMLDANNERLKELDKDHDELIRKGDFYAKPIYGSTQIFFSYGYEYEGKSKDVTKKEWDNTLNDIKYKMAGYKTPKGINPYLKAEQALSYTESLEIVPENKLDKEINGNIPEDPVLLGSVNGNTALDLLKAGNGVFSNEKPFKDSIDLGANIQPLAPQLPTIGKTVDVAVASPALTAIPNPNPPTIAAPIAPGGVTVSVTAPAAVTPITITAPTAPSPNVPADKVIAIDKPAGPDPFEPRMIVPPSPPATPNVITPNLITPPDLQFQGTGFWQNYAISAKGTPYPSPYTYIMVENFDTYSTDDTVTITVGATANGNAGGTEWTGGTITATTAYTYGTVTPGTYTIGNYSSTTNKMIAFINDLRDRQSVTVDIGGDYVVNYLEDENVAINPPVNDKFTMNKTFLSHNPAGVGNTWYLGFDTAGERITNFSGTLKINGLTSDTAGGVMVALEDQQFNNHYNVDSYATLDNTGTITLDTGNHMIGIMIDIEETDANHRKHNNVTRNSGSIVINGSNSIGVDFGQYYENLPQADVELGNIIVNGTKNYGFRMRDMLLKDNATLLFTENVPTYYDDVTVYGGNGKITVAGTKNVGLAIGKSLSSTAAPYTTSGNRNDGTLDPTNNAISNYFDINFDIKGKDNIGLLRLEDYSANNSADFVLNAQTMGTFDMLDGTDGSTLIRTDTLGITIDKDITISGTVVGDTGGVTKGNIIAHANVSATGTNNSRITNKKNLTSGMANTAALVATSAHATNIGIIENTGNITLSGEKSVAMSTDAKSTGKSTGGTITLSGASSNTGISNKGTFDLAGDIDINGTKSTALYNEGTFNIIDNTKITGTAGASGIYAKGGIMTLTTGKDLTIAVTGSGDNIGVYASDGANVTLNSADITVTGGSAGVAAYSGADLDLSGTSTDRTKLDYTGDGYAAFAENSGGTSIDLSYADITLHGKSVGTQLNMAAPNVTLANAAFDVQSLDAIGINILNQTTDIMDLNASVTSVGQLSAALSTALSGVTFTGVTGYTQAALENGTFNINIPLDKTVATGESGFFYRNLVIQALNLTVNADVTANLTTTQAMDFNTTGQVAALEMSSSKQAAGLSQTQINISAGTTVKAGRTDAGAGAIGAFINYGQMNNNGTIEIENAARNESGVGIYAVDGSVVTNNNNITVYGDKGIGILGTAYRELSAGGLGGQEFGGKAGEGETTITNVGTITIDGDKGVGIYLQNNSADPTNPVGTPVTTVKAENNAGANIVATGDKAVGIYAEGNGTIAQTIVTNNGSIEVGKDGVAIFAEKGVDVQKVGTLKLGEEALGVVLDKNSTISDTSAITPTATTPTGNKMVVALKSDTPGTNDPAGQSLSLDIDISGMDNGTAIYVWDRGSAATTVSSTGPLKIGNNGVGLYVENGHATNNGVITLDTNGTQAVGMYTKKGTIINANQIIANKDGQIGMIAKSATGIIDNQGTLDLNAQGTTGVFVDSGATATDSSLGNINFNSIKSFGVAADNAHVILNGGTYSMNNAGENIYVYATNNSDVAINGVLTIDGVAPADPAKSVGIYLNGTNVINNGASVTAQNGAMGVYANGANTLIGGTFAADGDKSVGVYFSNGGTLDGNTITSGAASGNSVGVYTAGGTVNIANPLTLNVGASGALGTGMYFANGSSAQGAAIDLTNLSATDVNVGAYYTGGTATHGTDINITPASTQVVALYADGAGTDVTSIGTITDNTAGSIGTMVGGGATLTNAGTVNANGTSSVGMYVDNGTGKNSGTINTGTGIGALVVGTGGTFDGTGGTINVAGAGAAIGLNGTGPGQVTNSGTLNLSNGSIGVYAYNNAVADLPVTLQGTGGTGIYAEAGSTVTGSVDASTSVDTVGVFLEDATATFNGATVTAGTSGTNASIGLFLGGTSQAHTLSSGTINAPAANTVGIYVPTTNTLSFGPATVNVGANALGIYAEGPGAQIDTNGGNLNIDAAGIGIYVKNGAVANVGAGGAINVTFNGAGGVLAFNDGGTINLGTLINITSGAGTLAATKDGSLSNSGTVNVSSGTVGLLGVYSATGTGTIENLSSGIMNVDAGGVGMAATGVAGATPTVRNDGLINASGASAVGMYGDVGILSNTSGTINADNGAIGMYIKDNASISDLGTINVTGGVGYVSEGIASAPTGNLTLNNGTATQYSIGGYYLNVTGAIASLPVIAAQGDYSIGTVIENGNNSVTPIITVPGTGTNQLGLMTKNATTAITGVTTSGDSNIGVFGENSTVTSTGSITVGNSAYSADKSASSIGVYMNGGTLNAGGQPVSAGDNSIGIFGKNANVTTGDVTAANTAVGVYVEGTGAENITVNGNVTAGAGSLGVYGKDTNSSVTGNLNVAEDLAVGIVGTGTGDITYAGNATVAPKVNSASIAIYKGDGQGTVNTSGTFDVGKAGYALYVDNKAGTGTVNANNASAITLNESSVGIYVGGDAVLNNTGNITVGATDLGGDTTPDHSDLPKHLNSVGIYAEAGAKAANGAGTTIIVDQDHSVGAYVTGAGTLFTNDGDINVNNGGVGVLVNSDAQVINNGNITLGYGLAPCGTESIGVGAYSGAIVTNNGTITVGEGTGAYIAQSAELINNGTIIVDNGVGVAGDGTYTNTGITVVGAGTANAGSSKPDPLQNGAIQISDGTVIVNNQYVHANGILEAQGDLVLNGATVILNKNNNLEFKANSINGEINLDPSFAQVMDNGYAATISGITLSATAGGTLTITTSPLFMAAFNKKGTEIAIAKQPYAYMVTGSQFDNLYNGIDSLLALDQEGKGNDSYVLKGLNAHLESVYQASGQEAFNSEVDRTLAEMRGDIYATIKGRMNRVENAFDKSFDELLSSYNFSRDTGKYSLIYNQSKYKDKTLGIDDYKYRTTGLLYMHEYEGRNYASKWGYTLGFGVSRFDFDDSPTFNDKSKEDVYSLRAGLHNVHSFGEDDRTRLVTKLEIGYNRHEAERTIELDQKYKNKAGYNTWSVSLDNRLEKTVYRSLSAGVDLYGEMDLEYAALSSFTEKAKGNSGLELKIKDRDYFSAEGALGVKGYKRVYVGKKISAKVTGDLAYAYEFAENYGRTKAKVAGGTEGYYKLIKPDEEDGKVRGNVGLTLEKADHYGVTFDVEARKGDNKKDADVRYGVRFNYKFGGGR